MKVTQSIDIRHLTRVEGHGNIKISIKDGKVEEATWEVVETPRFFEAMLVGKKWENAPWICGRICGICSIGHTLASIRAVENAFGIVPTDQTRKLRLLLKHMETLQSHVLHLYFLAAPDFVNVGSVFPLIDSHPDVVKRAAKIKLLANDLCDCVGGRRMHPTRTVIGGFTMLPGKEELVKFKFRLQDVVDDLTRTADLFRQFVIPDFARETEFVSLKGNGELSLHRRGPGLDGRGGHERARVPDDDERIYGRTIDLQVEQALAGVLRRRRPRPAEQQLRVPPSCRERAVPELRAQAGEPQSVHEQHRPARGVRACRDGVDRPD